MAFKVGEDVIVPLSHCPECGHKLDAANVVEEGEIQGTQPEPGDFTICLNCGHLMVFTEGLKLREPNDEEARIIAGDKRMLAVQKARGEVKRQEAVCTCRWSPVSTVTVDPPHIVSIDPDCPRHGHEVDEWEPNESGFSVHPVKRQGRDYDDYD